MFDNFSPIFKCCKCGRTVDDGSIVRKLCHDCLDKESMFDRLEDENEKRLERIMFGWRDQEK